MAGTGPLWREVPGARILWIVGEAMEVSASELQSVAPEAVRGRLVGEVLCLETLGSASCLKLQLPFFTAKQLGAASELGPVGLDTILRFCNELRSALDRRAPETFLCAYCSRRPGSIANSALLLGAFLILERSFSAERAWELLQSPNHGEGSLTEWRFPTPWRPRAEWSQDSLTLLDCLQGLEAALTFGWLDYETINPEHRRDTALAFDAAPIFQIELPRLATGDDMADKIMDSNRIVEFWVAADPVTTVVDPSDKPEAIPSAAESSAPSTPSSAGTSRSSLLVRQKSSIADAEATVFSVDPVNELLTRSSSKNSIRARPRSHPSKLDGKVLAKPERPLDMPAFAQWCRDVIRCQLIVRANFTKEKGLPKEGSYGDMFLRWGMHQADLQIPDGTSPTLELCVRLIEEVMLCLEENDTRTLPVRSSVLVHCKAGFGRSMCYLGALAIAFTPGLRGGAYMGWARLARPGSIQTAAQERFIRTLDDNDGPVGQLCWCLPWARWRASKLQELGNERLNKTMLQVTPGGRI